MKNSSSPRVADGANFRFAPICLPSIVRIIGILPVKTFAEKPLRVGPAAHELQKLLTGRGAMTHD